MHLLRNSMYATRKKHFPKLLNTVNEAVLQLKEFQVKFKVLQFMYFSDDNSVLLFTCSTNLSALCDAPHIFGDGTFYFLIAQNYLHNCIPFYYRYLSKLFLRTNSILFFKR
uniref:Uncharacterized protein n=1 Tax=Sipha flava TaxID=143950 RepID=A0A2S2R699_9HEMI